MGSTPDRVRFTVSDTIASSLAEALRPVYLSIRASADLMLFDRPLDEDIPGVRELLDSGVLTAGRT